MTYNPPKPTPEIVGEIICPACGAKTPVKVNKNGILYVYCHNEINSDTGEKCCHRITWGRAASRKFLRENNIEVLKNGAAAVGDIQTTGNDNREPDFSSVWGL